MHRVGQSGAGTTRAGGSASATFSLFAPRLPAGRGFLVAAGLDHCLRYLEEFRVTAGDVDLLIAAGHDRRAAVELHGAGFNGEVWAVPEGRVMFAGEPLLEVTGPAPIAWLVQQGLLERVRDQTAVASTAIRFALAAGSRPVIDLPGGLTPRSGPGETAARVAVIGGFAATADKGAARRHGLPVADVVWGAGPAVVFERDATTVLVVCRDGTDETVVRDVSGALAAVRRLRSPARVCLWLAEEDAAGRSALARRALDRAGLRSTSILVGGAGEEQRAADLAAVGAPVDGHLIDALAHDPGIEGALEIVSRLVEYRGRPFCRQGPSGGTMPGRKQIFRHAGGDLIVARGERPPPECRPLLALVMLAGRRLAGAEPATVARSRCLADAARLPRETRALRDPVPGLVRLSSRLRRLNDLALQSPDHAVPAGVEKVA